MRKRTPRQLIENLRLRIMNRFDLLKPFVDRRVTIATIRHPGFQHTFFGYYDRSPWCEDESKLLYLAVDQCDFPHNGESATVGYYDCDSGTFNDVTATTAWNFQQAAQQQWLDSQHVIVNDVDAGSPVTRTVNIETGETTARFPYHTGAIHRTRQLGVSFDYSQLYQREVDYGYSNLKKTDEKRGECARLAVFCARTGQTVRELDINKLIDGDGQLASLRNHYFWIQHPKWNPRGNRLLFALRARADNRRDWQASMRSSLISWNVDSGETELLLSADDWAAGANHPVWYDDDSVLMNLWIEKYNEMKMVRFSKFPQEFEVLAPACPGRGHPTKLPDSHLLVSDSRFFDRVQRLHLFDPQRNRGYEFARFRQNTNYRKETRCDLHPRSNRTGQLICFDTSRHNRRSIEVADISQLCEAA